MKRICGIVKEHKNIWERRTPLIPKHIKELEESHPIKFIVQPSEIRVFTDDEYREAGIEVKKDLREAEFIFGIKEMPKETFEKDKVYIFFSHTIKGQPYNMPMLKRLLEVGATLIDYELVTDENGRRLIFFGNYAGYAGAIDSLWALGKRFKEEGIETPFFKVKRALDYRDLKDARKHIREIGFEIAEKGLPSEITPFVVGIFGYGNVSKGVQGIIDLFPTITLEPDELPELFEEKYLKNVIYKVVFEERHMVKRKEGEFNLRDYYTHPENYYPVTQEYLPYITLLFNAIYWDARYPRFVTKKCLKELYSDSPRLKVIGDISCDIEGGVEATVTCTDPGNPVFLYDVNEDKPVSKLTGPGPLILAVDNLPAELARDSSTFFSGILKNFVPKIVSADYSKTFDELELPPELKKAVIAFRGELTPSFKYLEKYLK